jgi:hypothetical protein
MSTEVVRELFRSLENTLHDRLKVIEDILSTSKAVVAGGKSQDSSELLSRLQTLEQHFVSLDEYAMGQVRTLAYNHDQLEKRVETLENSMKSAVTSFQAINETIGMLQRRMEDDRPVEAVQAEAEVEEAQEAALNADIDAVSTEQKAQKALAKAVEELSADEEEEEKVEEEEVEEEEVEEEEVEEEEVEEEEVEEEEELELEEFEYKKKTYYRDQNCNVYIADEDGCVDPNMIVGIWNPKTKKIDRVSTV